MTQFYIIKTTTNSVSLGPLTHGHHVYDFEMLLTFFVAVTSYELEKCFSLPLILYMQQR